MFVKGFSIKNQVIILQLLLSTRSKQVYLIKTVICHNFMGHLINLWFLSRKFEHKKLQYPDIPTGIVYDVQHSINKTSMFINVIIRNDVTEKYKPATYNSLLFGHLQFYQHNFPLSPLHPLLVPLREFLPGSQLLSFHLLAFQWTDSAIKAKKMIYHSFQFLPWKLSPCLRSHIPCECEVSGQGPLQHHNPDYITQVCNP